MTSAPVQVRVASEQEIAHADGTLPFDRLDQAGPALWLIAWDGAAPVGHARIALDEPPELQNVWVVPERRRQGVARALARAAEREVRARGYDCLRLTASATNAGARAVWERLGYVRTDEPPERLQKTIVLRGREIAIDDTLIAFEQRLPAH